MATGGTECGSLMLSLPGVASSDCVQSLQVVRGSPQHVLPRPWKQSHELPFFALPFTASPDPPHSHLPTPARVALPRPFPRRGFGSFPLPSATVHFVPSPPSLSHLPHVPGGGRSGADS